MQKEKGKGKNGGGESSLGSRAGAPPVEITGRAFEFAVRITKLCVYLDEIPGVPRVLMPQILRAGTSVVANVEEAQAGQSKPDFISKMGIALKEARETHVRLRILAEAELVANSRLEPLIQEAGELTRILGAIIVSAKRNLAASAPAKTPQF